MESEFPSNTKLPPREEDVPGETKQVKQVDPVVTGEVKRRKKPLGRRFQETFFGGDMKGSLNFVIFSVLVPAAKDMLVEAGAQGIERLVFGETRRRSTFRGGVEPHRPSIQYNAQYRSPMSDRPPAAQISRRARARHDFDEIVLESRSEAEEVIDRMYDLLSRYDSASVADLYELTGIASTHTDQKWGWTDLRGSGVSRTRTGGFLLDLPEPVPLG
jgi:hypothetical protein